MTRLKPNKFREITAARKLLGFPETATMASIKASYRTLLAKWHPDKCREGKELCHQMTQKVIWAYKTIVDYCSNYEYSFTEQSIKRHLSPEEWWIDRFGDDPLWGKGRSRNNHSYVNSAQGPIDGVVSSKPGLHIYK